VSRWPGAGAPALALALLSVAVAVAACGGGSQGGGPKVSAADFRFEPKRVELQAGDSVTWTNTGQTAHTVKGPGFFSNRALDPGQSYSHRFARPGAYPYLCTLHPTLMKGVVVVR
jgi:plastocyanin